MLTTSIYWFDFSERKMSFDREKHNKSEIGLRIEFLMLKRENFSPKFWFFSHAQISVLESIKSKRVYEPTDQFLKPIKKRKVAFFNSQTRAPTVRLSDFLLFKIFYFWKPKTVKLKPFTDQTCALLVVGLTSIRG